MPPSVNPPAVDLEAITVEEISVVPKGDNRGAKILMLKTAPGGTVDGDLSDEAVDRIVAETLVEEILAQTTRTATYADGTTRTDTTTREERMTTRSDVAKVAKQRAAELRKQDPRLTEAQAMSRAWGDEDLATRWEELPAGEAQATAPVRKGGSTVAKVEAAAVEIRKADPSLTMAQARARAWEDDALGDEYEVALRG